MSGTRTARAGAVTSATNVVFERALMQAATESGSDIHLTSTGIWGIRSGFARVVQSAVAHFMAAEETWTGISTRKFKIGLDRPD